MTEPLVAKVDHVFVPVVGPKPLFRLFTETLGLPVAWPIHDYGMFASGGACLGNMNIEFVRGDPAVIEYFTPTEPLTVRGIAFEPAEPAEPDGWEDALAARDLRHVGPLPYEGTGHRGEHGHLWTNVFVGGMIGRAAVAFLCHYTSDEALRGDAAREALAACGGGLLGVREVAEVQIGISDMEKAEPRWRRLLDPVKPDRYGLFRMPDGPSIRLRRSPIDGVSGIVLEVASLDAAREALRERDLLGPMRRSGVGLDYARTGGLDIWLTQSH